MYSRENDAFLYELYCIYAFVKDAYATVRILDSFGQGVEGGVKNRENHGHLK